MKTTASSIERLEARIAPASVITMTDANLDKVKFTSSLGDLTGHITFTGPAGGHEIFSVDLSDASFAGTNFSVTVTKSKTGDGQVIVGHIDGGTNDLGKVSVAGDLGDIDAGSGSATMAAIKSLTVKSLGRFGQRGTGDYVSHINGSLPSLVVKGDFIDTYLRVNQTLTSASVGGSLIGGNVGDAGELYAGTLGKVAIKGDLRGGDGAYSGSVGSGGDFASITVGGSVIGGKGDNSGNIYGAFSADGTIGKVTIGRSVIGGLGNTSGVIGGQAAAGGGNNVSLGTVTIGHDLVGGAGINGGLVWAAEGTLDKLTLKGSLIGGSAQYAGQIYASHAAGSIFIAGSVYGGSGTRTGEIYADGGIGTLSIGGSLLGGSGANSARIYADGHTIGWLKIGHDIRGGSGDSSARVLGTLTATQIGGAVIPGAGPDSGKIG